MSLSSEEKQKERYLELLAKGLDKKKAAATLGVDLVMIRSWRMKDQEYNHKVKNFTIGKETPNQIDHKEPFAKLVEEGVSQREAARQLDISLVSIRTWKKKDKEFKERILKARFGSDEEF